MPEIGDIIGELYQAAGNRLAAYGYLLTGSQAEGEELVQAAVVKTFVRRRRLDDVHAAEGYVRATMRTMHIDGLRRDKTWRRLIPGIARAEASPDTSTAHATADEVTRALRALSPQVRTAVTLRYFDDLKVADVAEAMVLSIGTVKKYLSEGRDRLAPLLGVTDGPEVEWVDVVGGAKR